MFNTWISFFENELAEVVSFFGAVIGLFPSRLVAILFMFPALSMVFGLVTYAARKLKGGD